MQFVFGKGEVVFSLPNEINSFLGINWGKIRFYLVLKDHVRAWRKEKRGETQEFAKNIQAIRVEFVRVDP